MHLSKSVLYIGIITYSVCLLFFQDWPTMTAAVGLFSALFLAKMGVDIVFAGMGALRMFGPMLFAEEDDDDEVTIHAEDLQFSDTALFGFFLINVLANGGFHAWRTIMTTGGESFALSIWVIAEFIVLLFTWILWRHAVAAQRRKAKASRKAAAVQAATQYPAEAGQNVRPIDRGAA